MNTIRMVALSVFGLLAICLLVGWTLFADHKAAAAAAAPSKFPILPFDRVMGNPKAPVVLVEYGSPTCPHCAEFYVQNFQALKTKFIDTGKVRYVYRVFMLRGNDAPVEKLARCLPADQYFSFVGLLFENQREWDADMYPNIDIHTGLLEMAMRAGLAKDRADQCMRDPALNKQLNQVSDDATQKYAVNGTPSFLVNGVPDQAGEEWPHLQQRLLAAIAAK